MTQALDTLLQHPSLWRAAGLSGAQHRNAVPTGHPELDARLPGGGWPFPSLIEVSAPAWGIGEISLLVPALRHLLSLGGRRTIAWLNPPHIPYAPALERHGLDPARVMVVAPLARRETLWAMEQALRSGACAAVLGWVEHAGTPSLRRLKLAAAEGHCLGVLFRSLQQRPQASPAHLRLELRAADGECVVELLKVQGGIPGAVRLDGEGLHA